MSTKAVSSPRVIKGLVFDMDGTLTVPCIDFMAMRRRAGLPTEGDILELVNRLDEERRAEALSAIAEVEQEALDNLKLMPGLVSLVKKLDEMKLPRALVTRNVERSVEFFHNHLDEHHKLPPFHPAISRETPNLRFKPHPDALHHIAAHWCCKPSELMMIGDSIRDDVVSGNRAGSCAILIHQEEEVQGGKAQTFSSDHRSFDWNSLEGEQRPEFVVTSHHEFMQLLFESSHFTLQPPYKLAS